MSTEIFHTVDVTDLDIKNYRMTDCLFALVRVGMDFVIPSHARGENMDNVKSLRELYDAFGRGDIPTVLGAMSSEIHWHEAESNPYMPSGGAWVGPDAILNNLFLKLGAEWDGFSVHPKSFHNAGDSVIVEGRYSGKYKATGKSMDTQVCHIWDIKDGKVIRFQQYVDTAKLQDVMGRS